MASKFRKCHGNVKESLNQPSLTLDIDEESQGGELTLVARIKRWNKFTEPTLSRMTKGDEQGTAYVVLFVTE